MLQALKYWGLILYIHSPVEYTFIMLLPNGFVLFKLALVVSDPMLPAPDDVNSVEKYQKITPSGTDVISCYVCFYFFVSKILL